MSTLAQLLTEISTSFADNTSGAITPAVLRAQQNDVVNSLAGGAGIDASYYGFLPTATDSVNVTALQAAVNVGGIVYVSTPGNYNLNATVTCPSNVTLIFCPGCSLTKTANTFCHFLVNAGAATLTRNNHIVLIGNGCQCILNGNDSLTGQAYLGLRAQLAFLCVDDSVIDGFNFPDSGTTQFSVQVANVNRIKIKNLYQMNAGKDVVHINGPTYDVLVDGLTTNSADDCVAINAMDFNTSTPQYGAIEKVVVQNLTDTSSTASGSFSVRTIPGSWEAWTSGHTYAPGDVVTNAGNIYFNTSAGSHVAANAPVQTSGSVTGADGTTWLWKQAGTITSVNVTNVLVQDAEWAGTRPFWGNYFESTANMDSIYTGTLGNALTDQVVFRNIKINPPDTSLRFFMDNYSCAGYITLKDTNGTFAGASSGNRLFNSHSNTRTTQLSLLNDNITTTSDYYIQTNPTNCTLGTVVMDGGSWTGTTSQGNTSGMNPQASGQFTNIYLNNLQVNNVPLLFSWSAGSVVNLMASNCTFLGMNRLVRGLNAGTNINLFSSCYFGDPTTGLITNTANTSVKAAFVGCSGPVAANHICDANVELLTCNLPTSVTPKQVLGSAYRDSVLGWVQSNGTFFTPTATRYLDNRTGLTSADGAPITLYTTVNGTSLFRITADIFATAAVTGTAVYTIKWTQNGTTQTMVVNSTTINTLATSTDLINPDTATAITAQLTGTFTGTFRVAGLVEQLK